MVKVMLSRRISQYRITAEIKTAYNLCTAFMLLTNITTTRFTKIIVTHAVDESPRDNNIEHKKVNTLTSSVLSDEICVPRNFRLKC